MTITLRFCEFRCRCKATLRVVESAGEREKVLSGLFENYLLTKTKDPHLELVSVTLT